MAAKLCKAVLNALEICDHPEGSSSRRGGAPVRVVVVLATFQEVLVSVVVGLLIEYPRTIHHHAGVELTQLEGLVNWWAVDHTLCCLASKILFIIESDLPGLSIHLQQVKEKRSINPLTVYIANPFLSFWFPSIYILYQGCCLQPVLWPMCNVLPKRGAPYLSVRLWLINSWLLPSEVFCRRGSSLLS